MTPIVKDLTGYNLWANNKISAFALEAGDTLLDTPVKSSFPTIRKTIAHMWGAQWIWLERLNGNSPDHFPASGFTGDTRELLDNLLNTSRAFVAYAEAQDLLSLEKMLNYKNVKQQPYHSKVYEMIMHCMNHSTYHRGQLITMFREVGFTNVASTDLIEFYRERYP